MMILPEPLLKVINTLDKRGCQTYLVGGCVRDMLLRREPQDYDLLTSASLADIEESFSKIVTIGAQHGSLLVIADGLKIDISTMQTGQSKTFAANCSSLENDLARRDFSINAMALDLRGNLYDPWDGQRDLQDSIIRATRNMASELFSDDPLRMMRAIRLSTVYGFTIEPRTYAAIITYHHLLAQVAMERIREELNRILRSERPAQGIRMLQEGGLIPYVIPELALMVGLDQRNFRHNRDLFEHSLAVLEGVPARLNVRLAALLHDIGKPSCFTVDEGGIGHFYGHHLEGIGISREILKRLKYDQQTINDVSILVGAHMSRYAGLRDASLKKLITQVGRDNLPDLFALQKADIIGSAPPCDFSELDKMERDIKTILGEGLPLDIKDLAVNGTDLITLGYTPGPFLGAVLNELLELVLDDPAKNQPAILMGIAKQRLHI